MNYPLNDSFKCSKVQLFKVLSVFGFLTFETFEPLEP